MSGVRESFATQTPKKKCEPPQLPPDREDQCHHTALGGQEVVGVQMGPVAPWRNESSSGLARCLFPLDGRVMGEGWCWVGEVAHPPVQTGLLMFWSSKDTGLGSEGNSCLDHIAEGPGWTCGKHASQNVGLSKSGTIPLPFPIILHSLSPPPPQPVGGGRHGFRAGMGKD